MFDCVGRERADTVASDDRPRPSEEQLAPIRTNTDNLDALRKYLRTNPELLEFALEDQSLSVDKKAFLALDGGEFPWASKAIREHQLDPLKPMLRTKETLLHVVCVRSSYRVVWSDANCRQPRKARSKPPPSCSSGYRPPSSRRPSIKRQSLERHVMALIWRSCAPAHLALCSFLSVGC